MQVFRKLVLDLQNGHRDFATGRSDRRNDIILLMAEQSRSYRALVGDFPLGNVCLRCADNGENALATAHVNRDNAAHGHLVGLLRSSNNGGLGKNLVDLGDTAGYVQAAAECTALIEKIDTLIDQINE